DITCRFCRPRSGRKKSQHTFITEVTTILPTGSGRKAAGLLLKSLSGQSIRGYGFIYLLGLVLWGRFDEYRYDLPVIVEQRPESGRGTHPLHDKRLRRSSSLGG